MLRRRVGSPCAGAIAAHDHRTEPTPGTQARVRCAGEARYPAGSEMVAGVPTAAARHSLPRRPPSSRLPVPATRESSRPSATAQWSTVKPARWSSRPTLRRLGRPRHAAIARWGTCSQACQRPRHAAPAPARALRRRLSRRAAIHVRHATRTATCPRPSRPRRGPETQSMRLLPLHVSKPSCRVHRSYHGLMLNVKSSVAGGADGGLMRVNRGRGWLLMARGQLSLAAPVSSQRVRCIAGARAATGDYRRPAA